MASWNWMDQSWKSSSSTKKNPATKSSRQLYDFIDKGEREVAMRPELTPTLARIVADINAQFQQAAEMVLNPAMFRYERQQRGRLREHFQLNCDIIGEDSPEADMELIALAIDLVREFGFTAHDFVIRISDREFWTRTVEA